jgi:ABC-type multidrug transport system fused ATPase/permease subunit
MSNFFKYYRDGMSETKARDPIASLDQPKSIKDTLKRILPIIRPHWRLGLVGLLLVIISSLLSFPQPLVNRFLVDDVILKQQLDLLPLAVLLLIGINALSLLVGLLQKYFLNNFEQTIIFDLQSKLFEHTLSLPKEFFDQNEVGYLVSRISSDVQGLRWFFSGTVAYLLTNLVQFLGGIGFLFYLEWRLALASMLVLPVLALSVHYYSRHLRALGHRKMEQQGRISERFQETIASLPLVKAFSAESRESQRAKAVLEEGRQITMAQSVVSSVASTVINFGPKIAKGVVLIIGALLVIRNQWTLGSLLAFYSYLGLVFFPVIYFADANFSLQNALASLERIIGLFDIVPEQNLKQGKVPDRLEGEVVFEDVSFSYGDGEKILDKLSIQIKSGEHIAIIGPSGVGKTTLISLLLCFYRPSQGEVCFDGIPLSDYNLTALRKRIGYVSQSTLLLSGTFKENLAYGNPEASKEDIEKACKAAGIHDFITSLPEGYQSRIDERGVNLSEGQKQRLSIARALIKDPDILILDEPTAALDSIIERSIFDALPDFIQQKTLFIVAHRLSTIQNADRILLLNEKKLVGVGTHEQLLQDSSFYRELVENQQVSTAPNSN